MTAAACASTLSEDQAPAASTPARLTHNDIIISNTGWKLEPWKWAATEERRALLRDQSDTLADLLEAAGVAARQPSDVVAISAVTGIVEPMTAWRPIRFLPAVASRDRRPMLNALGYWVKRVHVGGYYVRYGVVTTPELVPAFGDLRGVLQGLARLVSKWADEVDARYGIRVHFRGSEFTRQTAAERELDDRYPADLVLYHPHANVMYEPTRLLPEKGEGSWEEFLSWSHDYFGAHWKDCGRVKDVRELVKYVVKPGELTDGPKPLTPDEAKWLHNSLFRLNLAQPLGDFRLYWRKLSEEGKKVVTKRLKNGTARMCVVDKDTRLDHSKRPDPAEDEEAADDAEQKPARRVPQNTILGVSLPQWKHSPWAEPMIIVQNYEPRAVGRKAMERLREIEIERMHARDLWDKSGAPNPRTALEVAKAWREKQSNVTPFRNNLKGSASRDPYRVHTSRLTVRRGAAGGEPTGKTDPPARRGQVVPLKLPGGPPVDIGPAEIDIWDRSENE